MNRSIGAENGSFAQKSPSLHLNLQLLFCANFDSAIYTEGLSYLSSLIRFFQLHKRIALDRSNDTSSVKNKLSFELCKLDYAELSHLWSAIGSKLMPSVLYKVSMLVFDDAPIRRIIPAVKETENKT
jgi:hypothetical protein